MTTREPPGSGFPEALADTNQHTLDLLGRLPGAPPAALTALVPPVQEDFSWSVAESAALRGREATAVLPGPGASRPALGSVEGVGCKASPGRFVVGPARSQEQGWFLFASWAPGPHRGGSLHCVLTLSSRLVGNSCTCPSCRQQAQEAARLKAEALPSRKPCCPGCCHLHAQRALHPGARDCARQALEDTG